MFVGLGMALGLGACENSIYMRMRRGEITREQARAEMAPAVMMANANFQRQMAENQQQLQRANSEVGRPYQMTRVDYRQNRAATAGAGGVYASGSGTYQRIGNTTYGPNGQTWQQIGNTTYGPNGTYQRIGNTTFGPSGTYQHIGNTTYGPNGQTWQRIGNTTYGPGGQTIQRIGNTSYVNP